MLADSGRLMFLFLFGLKGIVNFLDPIKFDLEKESTKTSNERFLSMTEFRCNILLRPYFSMP